MEKLEQQLIEIQELIKNMGGMQLPLPKIPKPVAPIGQPKMPSAAPAAQKNPVNVAQQIQDQSSKKIAVKQAKSLVKYDKNGQWKLEDC